MIVGCKHVDPGEILAHCKSVQTLKDYCAVLVPRILRHNVSIVNNQKYFVALYVRDFKSIPYKERKELCEGLLRDVSITGLANSIYDFEDIISEVDIEKLAKYVAERKDN